MDLDSSVKAAAKKIRTGALVAYPTEGVWGLGCDPANRAAVLRLLKLKQRAVDKGLILVAEQVAHFAPFLRALPTEFSLRPGAFITWVIDHGGAAPAWLSGGRNTLAVRLSTHPLIGALCQAADMALVSTSANPAGAPPATTAEQVHDYFGAAVDTVPGELGTGGGPSEMRDYQTGELLRPSAAP
ncbi:MAG: Sua5/YciO/YrdC/YwlC family protein [Cellvibrionales bacterium]|nr:Sua5/YciO/YrdC/YwlC family protein [Cellvibrionales bacterium]